MAFVKNKMLMIQSVFILKDSQPPSLPGWDESETWGRPDIKRHDRGEGPPEELDTLGVCGPDGTPT